MINALKSLFYFIVSIFICTIILFIYTLYVLIYVILFIYNSLKKTIKNEKTKPQPEHFKIVC
jgi:predicted membrane protein